MRFQLPQQVVNVLTKLEACGFEAYVVGGCVRDYILGIEPHEFDICSSAEPKDVYKCFKSKKILNTGLKHGTVTLLTDGYSFEITTFRSDGTYSDQRHPDSVKFSKSICEDLKRRDFTANAMAFSPLRGFVDPFNGAEACRDKRLIAVGEAMQRFGEDALRILRAIRFSSTLGFSIETKTEKAMVRQAHFLEEISRERVASEINRTLIGKAAASAFRHHAQILLIVMPQLDSMLKASQKKIWMHTLEVMKLTPPELSLRWAALLHESGKPSFLRNVMEDVPQFYNYPMISTQIADNCLISLRQSNKLQQNVHQLVFFHNECINIDNLQKWLSKLGLDMLKKLLTLQQAISAAQIPEIPSKSNRITDLILMAESMVAKGVCLNLRDLEVNGDILIRAGIPKGPDIGKTLNHLLNLVLSNKANNDEKELINLAIKDFQRFSD